jgi:transposase
MKLKIPEIESKTMHFLSEQERTQLKIQHKRERDKCICDRIKAILLYDEGWTPAQIAKVLLLYDEFVRKHIDEYINLKKLHTESGSSEEKLSKEQSANLENHLQIHTYLYVKDMVSYVETTFGVVYTVPGLRSWLKRHGFSYKKLAVVSGKADKEQQAKWVDGYEKLREALLKDETLLLWMESILHTMCNLLMGGLKKALEKKYPLIPADPDSIFPG